MRTLEYTFKWGIGNDYMLRNRLRYLPPTLPRPKQATIEANYFRSPSGNMLYDRTNEAWEVRWFANGKFHGKPFPIKKFGVDRAKAEALAFGASLAGAASGPNYSSEISGVFWDERTQAWFAKFTCPSSGLVRSRGYSADKHGFEEARRKAEDKRKSSPEFGLLRNRLFWFFVLFYTFESLTVGFKTH
jgi:hypothetical protein